MAIMINRYFPRLVAAQLLYQFAQTRGIWILLGIERTDDFHVGLNRQWKVTVSREEIAFRRSLLHTRASCARKRKPGRRDA